MVETNKSWSWTLFLKSVSIGWKTAFECTGPNITQAIWDKVYKHPVCVRYHSQLLKLNFIYLFIYQYTFVFILGRPITMICILPCRRVKIHKIMRHVQQNTILRKLLKHLLYINLKVSIEPQFFWNQKALSLGQKAVLRLRLNTGNKWLLTVGSKCFWNEAYEPLFAELIFLKRTLDYFSWGLFLISLLH